MDQPPNSNYVAIPENSPEASALPPGSSVQGLHDKMAVLGEQTNWVKLLMSGVVVVLFIGFLAMFATLAGIFIDTWRYNVNSYIDYQESMKSNVENFDGLNLKLAEMNNKLNSLEQRFSETKPEIPSSSP